MAPWSRKSPKAPQPAPPPPADPAEVVPLDDADHAWWARADVEDVWKPRDRKPPREERPDILAEHFGEDWRTNFLGPDPMHDVTDGSTSDPSPPEALDPYQVLEVSEDATWEEIVAAHRYQARVHHPDRLFGQSEAEKAESEDRIRVINQAYRDLQVRRGM